MHGIQLLQYIPRVHVHNLRVILQQTGKVGDGFQDAVNI